MIIVEESNQEHTMTRKDCHAGRVYKTEGGMYALCIACRERIPFRQDTEQRIGFVNLQTGDFVDLIASVKMRELDVTLTVHP
jgi:hypothetical protein